MLLRSQKSIAKKIIEGDSDYILSLKDNHPTLHQQVKNWFETSLSLGFKGVDVNINQRVEKGHHRIENRQVYTAAILILKKNQIKFSFLNRELVSNHDFLTNNYHPTLEIDRFLKFCPQEIDFNS